MFAYFQSGPHRGHALAVLLALAASTTLVTLAADAPAAPAATAANATTPAATPDAAGNATTSNNAQMQAENDLGTLEWILNLPPERLTALRKALENFEKMPLGERVLLRHEVQLRIQSLNQLRGEIGSDLRKLTPEQNNVLRQYFLILTSDQIQALRDRFAAATTPEARKTVIDDLLKNAADRGIKPEMGERGPPGGGPRGNFPGGRGGRGGFNGRGNGGGRPPPPPSPLPEPAAPAASGAPSA